MSAAEIREAPSDPKQPALWESPEPVTVHCMFHCKKSGRMVVSPDPVHAHDVMEAHYRQYHSADIGRIVSAELTLRETE